jgi:hypothetical protein
MFVFQANPYEQESVDYFTGRLGPQLRELRMINMEMQDMNLETFFNGVTVSNKMCLLGMGRTNCFGISEVGPKCL